MSAITQRSFRRNYYEAPILYSIDSRGGFRTAKMYNMSVGGMYFESETPLKPGATLYIKMTDCAPDPYWPEACGSYLAEVRWCLERNDEGVFSYGIGARILMETCRKCGATIPHHDEHFTGLCPDCFGSISTLSDPIIKSGIENYLMGNVI